MTDETPRAASSIAGGTSRILHAPADVGGHVFTLSRAERELGLHSDVAVLAAGPFGYGADIRLDLQGKGAWRSLAARTRLLGRALRSYDIIHFNFGQSLVPLRVYGHVLNELPLIKRAGKTILVTFQGCDVRPQESCFCNQEHCRAENPYRAPNAARFLHYADRCFHLNPDLARWLPGSRFLPYANVDPLLLRPGEPRSAGEEVVVMHAPTDRDVKGTRYVLAAIERLQAEGVAIRLDLIEGVPHTEVLRRLREADFVVDQLLLGWYGGFAVEAMALAKPVLCHIREGTPAENPFGAELPIVRTTPDTLVERIRELAADREARARIGTASRAFVELRHDPRTVAREMLSGLVELPAPCATAQV
jgi:glycosyltransferase involved in cell wall biosynthesis